MAKESGRCKACEGEAWQLASNKRERNSEREQGKDGFKSIGVEWVAARGL